MTGLFDCSVCMAQVGRWRRAPAAHLEEPEMRKKRRNQIIVAVIAIALIAVMIVTMVISALV